MKVFSDEQSFLQSFANHSEKALKAFFDSHYKTFAYFTTQFSLDLAESEAVVQESFVTLFKIENKFHSVDEIKNWMYNNIRETLCGINSLVGIETISYNDQEIKLDLYRMKAELIAALSEI